MDKIGADFNMTLESIEKRLSDKAVPIQFPYGQADEFKGVVNLVDMKYYTFEGEFGADQKVHDIPEDVLEKAQSMREALIDTVSIYDDVVVEKFLEGEEITEEELKKVIRK